ncbi:MAG: hypothetical protein ACTIOK_08660 [Enterococcus malodoratus]
MEDLFELLTAKDTKEAMTAFKQLEVEASTAPIYADDLASFLPALNTSRSCGRGRTFKFFMINARWDSQKFIETHLEEILAVLDDPKAPIVRQCIPYLTHLAKAKPELIPVIKTKLANLDLSQYKESMRSLIERDSAKLLAEID